MTVNRTLLWFPGGNTDKQPEEYYMLVYLFGCTSSPSCGNYALKKTAHNNKDFDAVTLSAVNEFLYSVVIGL